MALVYHATSSPKDQDMPHAPTPSFLFHRSLSFPSCLSLLAREMNTHNPDPWPLRSVLLSSAPVPLSLLTARYQSDPNEKKNYRDPYPYYLLSPQCPLCELSFVGFVLGQGAGALFTSHAPCARNVNFSSPSSPPLSLCSSFLVWALVHFFFISVSFIVFATRSQVDS